MTPTTYLFTKTNDAIDQLTNDTGLTASSSVWSLADQVSFTFPDELSANDFGVLSDYMLNQNYSFVSMTQ